MKLKSETYEEYSDLTPTDRTISRLTMAAEIVAASNLDVISPGNEPWEVKVDSDSLKRSVSTFLDMHVKARSVGSQVRRSHVQELLKVHKEAIASGDKVTAAQALSALRKYSSGKIKRTRRLSTSDKPSRQKQR
jgi:hypothetical protein